MARTGPIHHLTNVDREHRTAICSVCGPTQIYLAKGRGPNTTRAYCITRIRETEQRQSYRRKPLQDRKLRHLLTNINAEKMIALCSVCGPTEIRKRQVNQKGTFYICAKKKREYAREYRFSHYVSHPREPRTSGHSLSQIDYENKTAVCRVCGPVKIYVSHVHGKLIRRCSKANIKYVLRARQRNEEIIENYLLEHGCKGCGYHQSPLALQLHRRNPEEKDDKIYQLVLFSRDRLLKELEKSDVLCMNCHCLLHAELGI